MSDHRPVEPILQVQGVSRTFRHRGVSRVALVDVGFDLRSGRTLAVVGESGAGKSTLARLIAGLDTPTSGVVRVQGEPPRLQSGRASTVQMVFQNPADALNPYHSIARSVAEPLRHLRKHEKGRRVAESLEQVGLHPDKAHQRPSAYSGGQQQRAVIARALAASPRILICDEPTSALDVSVQAQIVNLLLRLQQDLGFATVLVTHDLTVVRALADDVLVLRYGQVVERTEADQFFRSPKNAYSRDLLAAVSAQALMGQPHETGMTTRRGVG